MKLLLTFVLAWLLALAAIDHPISASAEGQLAAAPAGNQSQLLAEAAELPAQGASRASLIYTAPLSPALGPLDSLEHNTLSRKPPPGKKPGLYALNLALLI